MSLAYTVSETTAWTNLIFCKKSYIHTLSFHKDTRPDESKELCKTEILWDRLLKVNAPLQLPELDLFKLVWSQASTFFLLTSNQCRKPCRRACHWMQEKPCYSIIPQWSRVAWSLWHTGSNSEFLLKERNLHANWHLVTEQGSLLQQILLLQ